MTSSLSFCLTALLISLAVLQVSSQYQNQFPNQPQNTPVDYGSYKLTNKYQSDNHIYHYIAEHSGNEPNYKGNSPIIQSLHMIISFHNDKTFRIKILDNHGTRWEIPEKTPFPHFTTDDTIPVESSSCSVEIQENPFSFVVSRRDTSEILFDTRGKQFIYSNFYIELTTTLPTEHVYGFGERNSPFKLENGVHTIWGRDDARIMHRGDLANNGGSNTYSHHPVGLIRDSKGDFFMTLMRNSNAMDVVISQGPQLTFKMIGGVIDLVFFIGGKSPEPVMKAYHNYLGNFTMMPFWSMGFQQSKWGYTNHQEMENVVMKYDENNIPLDVIWSDIDYMIDKEIFTIDEWRFPCDKMRELSTKHKKKWVPIIDPGVKIMNTQGPGANVGVERDIFIKNKDGQNLVGSVWPGRVHFPDFFNPNAEKYWLDMLDIVYQKVPFDGIWLDMNEVANFVNGEDNRWDWNNVYDNLPYVPGNRLLRTKTISLDAVHHGNILEYDVHGLFSLMENEVTHKFLQTKSKLPFILTRSSSMGLGRYSAHWSGDNGATWDFLQVSIPGNFNFQIFGIPFVGADICGFMGDTNAELCARWTQVGALYPFARNHHELETRHQEPWTFVELNQGISVVETARASIKARYSILKWYYSLFIETRGAGTIFKALMFEFPEDPQVYSYRTIDWEFMLGSAVLCTPKVESGEPFIQAYFPIATWFDLFTGRKMIDSTSSNRDLRVETPFNGSVPQFIRSGHIVHKQNVDRVLTTADLNDEFELVVALEKNADTNTLSAKGSIMGVESFDDDTIYYRCMEDNCLYDLEVTVTQIDDASATISVKINTQSKDVKTPLDEFGLSTLTLYGLPLSFLKEDEKTVGFALVEVSKANGNALVMPDIKTLVQIEEQAFQINFGTSIRVEDGDSLEIELLI